MPEADFSGSEWGNEFGTRHADDKTAAAWQLTSFAFAKWSSENRLRIRPGIVANVFLIVLFPKLVSYGFRTSDRCRGHIFQSNNHALTVWLRQGFDHVAIVSGSFSSICHTGIVPGGCSKCIRAQTHAFAPKRFGCSRLNYAIGKRQNATKKPETAIILGQFPVNSRLAILARLK